MRAAPRPLPSPDPAGSVDAAIQTASRIGFWTAVLLPLVYVPLLLFSPPVPGLPLLVGVALGLNVAALLVGHGYEPDPASRSIGGGNAGA